MIVAGIDIGSRGAKGILMKDGEIISSQIGDTGPESVKTSYMTMDRLLNGTGLALKDINYVVATGYGRVLVPFANENISEISCHARGITFYYPSVRTILDMGGQDCKAINCTADGTVTNFVMNDKCAGGTGRFLEMIADVLGVKLTDIGALALESKGEIPFNTICAVFAKSEAITALRKGAAKPDILAGLNEAIATRCLNLLKRISIQSEFTITGGIAKNKGMVAKIEQKVGHKAVLAPDPQLIGALGAAIFAADRLNGGKIKEMKVHYGYTDATGDYFISIDRNKCDGCGLCVKACPAGIFEMTTGDSGAPKAAVKESARKRLAQLCPGHERCKAAIGKTCHAVCKPEAIGHSW